jgi:hypothetical protein
VRRAAPTALALVLACGEIREVTVPDGTTTAGSTSTDASSTTLAQGDRDDASTSSDPTSGTTTLGESTHDVFCGSAFEIGTELAEGENALLVEDEGAIADLDVSVRLSHESIFELEIALVHDRASVVLLEPGTVRCTAQLDGMFDDEADAPDDGCGAVDESGVTRLIPVQSLSDFDGESITGQWQLVIGPSDTSIGDVTGWCVVVELE